MKRILLLLLLLTVSLAVYAQSNVTKFLGIPVEGTKSAMIQNLKTKGFVYNQKLDYLEGEFNGMRVHIYIHVQGGKVWRLAVVEKDSHDESQIKTRYEKLCEQFERNPKYLPLSVDTLPESKDLSYELVVHKKKYQAVYIQLPIDEDSLKRVVWVTFLRRTERYSGEYSIVIYYENGFNEANGEDL